MLQLRFSALFSFAITLALAMFVSCSSGGDDDDSSGGGASIISSSGGNVGGTSSSGGNVGGTSSSSNGGGVVGDFPFNSDGETLTSTPGLAALAPPNRIDIEYQNGTAPVINNSYTGEVTITPNGEDVVISIKGTTSVIYNFVISGTAKNGSLKFYGDVEKVIYLNGVNITNSKGPAINIQKSKKVLVHLVSGTQNFLTDGTTYTTLPGTESEDAKGTFFSEGKLEFEGSGSLEVKGKYNHAIVVDNGFEMNNGKIVVSGAVGDGVHANDEIKMKGGFLKITSNGDAIQNENENDSIRISGGKIAATTTGPKSHGIAAEGPISISGTAIVQLSVNGNGSKGIRGRKWLEIKGGNTSIKVSGTKYADPADTEESTPAGIKLGTDLFVEGGTLTVKSPGSEAKGVNINNGTISGGTVNIEADDDGIKVQETKMLKITGGTVYVKSAKKKAIDGTFQKTSGNVTLIPEP